MNKRLLLLLVSLLLVSCSNHDSKSKYLIDDLDYLSKKLQETHPDKDNIESVLNQLDNYKKSISNKETKSKSSFRINLMKILAKFDDSHTGVLIGSDINRLPIEFVNINSEVIIINSSDKSAQRGDKILKVSGQNINSILNDLKDYIPYDNEEWFKQQINYLTLDFILYSMELVENEKVILTVERNGQTLDYALGFDKLANQEEKQPYGWELKSVNENKIGYFEIVSSIFDSQFNHTLDEFFDSVNNSNINKILIDLRENSGGDSRIVKSFIEHLNTRTYRLYNNTYFSQKKGKYSGEIYILTSSGTYSSGMMFATIIKDNGLGKTIGEPVGQNPNHYGDPVLIELPNSKLNISISQTEYIRPAAKENKSNILQVDIPLPKTKSDFLASEDEQLERALNIIEKQE